MKSPSISGDLLLVVASRFLRRSGSRVSILMACRRTGTGWFPVSALTLGPLGQPEKALGHEPQIEPWLTHHTTAALASFRNRSAPSLLKKMHLLRWNNISTQVRGAQHQTCVFYGQGGWKPRKCFPAPVEGEISSLTFPFIEPGHNAHNPLDECNGDLCAPG